MRRAESLVAAGDRCGQLLDGEAVGALRPGREHVLRALLPVHAAARADLSDGVFSAGGNKLVGVLALADRGEPVLPAYPDSGLDGVVPAARVPDPSEVDLGVLLNPRQSG